MRFPFATKLLATTAILGVAAGIAGLGTYASFTSSTSAEAQNLSAGTVSLTLGGTDRLTISASNLVPADTIERAVDVVNNGSAGTSSVGSITLTTNATTSSLLDSDATNGLQMQIDNCSVAWTESGPPYTYTCSGTQSVALASTPVIGTNMPLANMSAITAGNTDHLRVTLTFPAGATNALQGLSSTIDYVFTAEQRAAGSQ